MNLRLYKKGIRNIVVFLLMLLLLQAAGCTAAGREKQTESGKDEAVIEVLVTTSSWTRNIEEIEMFRDLSEKTGVRVIWKQVRSGSDALKNAMLSSGNVPDVFLGDTITDADIAAYPELFLPMNELLAEDAPNVQRMFREKPDTLKLALFTDGNIYGLPSVKFHRPDSMSMLMINREWLDRLGLSKPETLEEFKNVLIAFRDGDPNGNGKADEIPFDFANSRSLFSAMNLIGAYGNYAEDFSGEWFGMKDGKVKFLPITEDYYKLVVYLHELFAEGLINQNVFSQDYSQFQQKAKISSNMTVGATLGWSVEDRVGTVYESSYEVLLPLRADEEIAAFWPSHAARCKYETNRVVITTSNPYPKETMKWINEMYGEEFSVQAIYGSFGVGVERTADGYAVLPAPAGKTADEWKWINSLAGNAVCYASDELDQLLVPPASIAKTLEQYKQYEPYFQTEEDILPRLKFTKEEADQLAIIKSGIYKLVDEKWIKWITVGGIEEEWADYLNQMHLLGADTMLAIYQKELEFYKTGGKE
ncbi:MAG TPA: hypothetical protein DCR27_11415 [Lachnospiraceae bacterium]|nr:hypothetical protein [Lachnospiraceae bacterium]